MNEINIMQNPQSVCSSQQMLSTLSNAHENWLVFTGWFDSNFMSNFNAAQLCIHSKPVLSMSSVLILAWIHTDLIIFQLLGVLIPARDACILFIHRVLAGRCCGCIVNT